MNGGRHIVAVDCIASLLPTVTNRPHKLNRKNDKKRDEIVGYCTVIGTAVDQTVFVLNSIKSSCSRFSKINKVVF